MAELSDYLARGVRAERSRRGWRQSDLAARCGWSVDTVSAIERGARRVDIDDAAALCRALGVTLAKLLDGAEAEDLRSLGLSASTGEPGSFVPSASGRPRRDGSHPGGSV
ncbi:MAG TPA: helix-turn-helix transcriptional regulator [Kineosporiaceae bacterium]|nr:helix-turn-helix transcriptional regulator [Kineosporiaceae bacterium]